MNNDGSNEEEIPVEKKKFVLLEAHKRILLRALLMLWLIQMVFLFLRAFLELFGADPHSIFAGFIYVVSSFFLVPFFGIFPNFNQTIQPGRAMFDAPALTAMVCYSVLIFLAVCVIYILTKIAKTERQVDETIKKEKITKPSEAESEIE